MLKVEDFYGAEDSPAIRVHIHEAIDTINGGLRQGLFGRVAADMMAIAKVLHLRQLEKAGALPDCPGGQT